MNKLITLVTMQLKDKLDLSFTKSVRSIIFKIVLTILQFALITAVFYLAFAFATKLSIFGLSKDFPDTVLSVIFTLIELMSIITCTVGLTKSFYKSQDNKVLLTFPVGHDGIFFSKLVLYYIFELKKNLTLTLPMFFAYGLHNGAVWYYYPWLIVCYFLVSLLPIAIGSVLSIPWLVISSFIEKRQWLEMLLTIVLSVGVGVLIIYLVGFIPEDIKIVSQWNKIREQIITPFLKNFNKIFKYFYAITLMIVGGKISTVYNDNTGLILGNNHMNSYIFSIDTLLYFGIVLATLLVFLTISYLLVKPLFFKMASKQFEYEKMVTPPKKNAVHSKLLSPLSEELKQKFRSSDYIVSMILQLMLPAILVYLLNKIYAAMDASFNGIMMMKGFNMLVFYITVLSFNIEYASIYSRDGNARHLTKTRPVNPALLTFSRLVPRIIVSTLSVFIATLFYIKTSKADMNEFWLVAFTATFVSIAHLLWCAELDIMNPQSEQYATIGMDYNSPNESIANIIALLISAFFAFLTFYLGSEGLIGALIKLLVLSVVLLGARIYLYFIRVKLYYKEK